MRRMYHAPIEVDGHMFLVDMPWFMSREESDKWHEDFEAWARKIIKEKEKK